MQTVKPARPKGPRKLRRLHRGIGISAAVFLLLLCVSGILLNHSPALGLDRQFLALPPLLDRYGIPSPDPGPSFVAGARRVTLLEDRLYVDRETVGVDVPDLVGAVAIGDLLTAATTTELLVLDSDPVLLERWPVAAETGAPIEAIGRFALGIAFRSGGDLYLFDWDSTLVEPFEDDASRIDWSEASEPGDALVDAMISDYRGNGISVERILTDLHSGRLVGLSGAVVMDLAGLALIFLSVSGILLWWRR